MLGRNKWMVKASALLSAVALTAGVFTIVSPGAGAAAKKTYTIGATLPLTGSGAPYGQLFLFGINQAASYINSHGGVGAKHAQLKVVALDDQGLAGPAVIDTKQLVNVNHAIAILTAYNDPPLAQYKVGNQLGVPIINVGGNDPAIPNHTNLYSTASIFTGEEVVAFTYAKAKLGLKSVGILNANNYTTYDINAFNKFASNIFGASNVHAVTIDATQNDFTTQLQTLQASKPDIISPMSSGTLTLSIAQEMTQLKMTQKVGGISGMLTTPANIVNEPAWLGAFAGVAVQPPAGWLNAAVLKASKSPANVYHEFSANGTYLVADAINAIISAKGKVTGKNVNSAIAKFCKKGTKLNGAGLTFVMLPSHVVSLGYVVQGIGAGGAISTLQTLTSAQVAAELKAAGA
jgi:ABC-type branched-subunit amino acid transport system substrate-binding protein